MGKIALLSGTARLPFSQKSFWGSTMIKAAGMLNIMILRIGKNIHGDYILKFSDEAK